MKRKRGRPRLNKAPKVVTPAADPKIVNLSSEDVSSPSEDNEKDETTNSRMDIETPSTGTDQPEKPPAVISTGVIDKPVGRLVYNRVKLKIKTSKALEPQITSFNAHTQSDTDKSSQHIGVEKKVVSEKVEGSANSVYESNVVATTNQPKKAGSIKISLSKGFGSRLSPCNNSVVPQAERTRHKESESVSRDPVHNRHEREQQKEPGSVSRDNVHNKEEQKQQKEPESVSQDFPCNKQEQIHQKEPELVSRDPVYNKQEQTHQKESDSVSRDLVHNKQEPTHLKELESVTRDPVYNKQEQTHQKESESVSRDSFYTKQEQALQKEPGSLSRGSVYNKQELNASLEVIKKIMKMDAAEPFNVPVNPVALGIPDYFDVIKTPMDFGTICSNLESGLKYKNSEDVYKDVEYIWQNCYKYNNKGDYILELMKRVKKNFSKNWDAAGLYSEYQQGDLKDGNISSHGSKSGLSKHKSGKRHGFKSHKEDCLCAICIMVRRRRERELTMQSADDQTETSGGFVQGVKTEGTSTAGSLNGDDTSSGTYNSQNQDADTEMEDKGEERKPEKELQTTLQSMQHEEKEKLTPTEINNQYAMIDEQYQLNGKSGTDKNGDIQMAEAGDATNYDANNEEKRMHHEYETAAIEHQKPKELMTAAEKAKVYETLRQRYDNPMVLDLCASLFPENSKSLWGKPYSLVNRRGTSRSNAISAAITSFMKF